MENQAKGTLYHANGTIEPKQFNGNLVTLQELQDCVGGYVEFVYLENNQILVVNEEGKINNLQFNPLATNIAINSNSVDYIVGNALLIDLRFID
jgi:hypothetical protein